MADRKSVARNGTRHGRDTVTRTTVTPYLLNELRTPVKNGV